jgi:hypothetical protein
MILPAVRGVIDCGNAGGYFAQSAPDMLRLQYFG